MGMEGMPGAGTAEADPLAHLLEESGLENTAENRQEAEEIKAAFTQAREKDANLSPEQKEEVETEISERQLHVIDGGARFAAKAQILDRRLGESPRPSDVERNQQLLDAVSRAKAKLSLYKKATLGSFAGATAGILVPITLSVLERATGMDLGLQHVPDAIGLILTSMGVAGVLGMIPFTSLVDKWQKKRREAVQQASAEGIPTAHIEDVAGLKEGEMP
jgi:hypothetical protein